jgi:hypothetical protein
MSLNSKLSVLQQKSVVLQVKEVKVPENSANPLALFESNSAARSATANEWIIDVFPNQIPIVTYLMKLALAASSAANHKDNSKSSLATFCLYYLTVFQAFFLLNDLHVRPSPSSHATSWSTISWKHQFAEWLLSLPVPELMEPILAQLSASQTDKTRNVFFVPTAAGFNINHFFGRFIPLNFFTNIHDCIATMPGNSRPLDIHQDLLPRALFSLTDDVIPNKTTATMADFLGITATSTTANFVASKWYQSFAAIFNPVLFRDFHRRSSLATLDLNAPYFDEITDLNAYDILFSATPHNLRELKVVLQHVATVLTDTVPCKKTLSQVISSSSGINITAHGYSTYALPTWTTNSDTETDLFDYIDEFHSQSTVARAAAFHYLENPANHNATTTVTAAEITQTPADATSHISRLNFPWSLVSLTASTNPWPRDFTDFVTFNDENHVYPRVLVLDTLATTTVSAHLATLTGKIIETFEIDGTTIELPNADKSLAMQNCMFADSAIPLRLAIRATRFHIRNDQLPPVRKRHLARPSTSLPASSLIYDRTKINLPCLPAHTTPGQARIMDPVAPDSIPGMTQLSAVNWLRYAQSFIGLRTKISTATTDADLPPATPEGRFYVWSPYTYTSYEDDSPRNITPDLTENRTYFLTNLRTLFGTDYNLIEVVHPMEAMPI